MTPESSPVRLVDQTSNQPLVDMIQDLLDMVKSGDVVAVAFVEVRRGRSVGTCWSDVLGDGGYHLLNSGAATLSARLASKEP